jgi:hypothetical protein
MAFMFKDAAAFNQNLDSWTVSNETETHKMLEGTARERGYQPPEEEEEEDEETTSTTSTSTTTTTTTTGDGLIGLDSGASAILGAAMFLFD